MCNDELSLQSNFFACCCHEDGIDNTKEVLSNTIRDNSDFLRRGLKVFYQCLAGGGRNSGDDISRGNCFGNNFFKISRQFRYSVLWMLDECQVVDCDNLAHLTIKRRQDEIGAVIDIYMAREKSGRERESPAVPENIEIAVGNNEAACPYISCFRKRALLCGASSGEQGILVLFILLEHSIHQVAHIVTNACLLSNGGCIINRNTHGITLQCAYPR